ncbi:MAG: hypothetical protein IJV40_15980 [Oscillospiraceae bacterium]|nr:hypothetical protein [Oscillospiraceae bacterium]
MDILTKQQMTEEDIKLNYITPAIQKKGWKDKITMETAVRVTDGKVNLRGNIAVRGNPHEEEEILDPLDLIHRYQEERASLNAEIDRVLAEITEKLGGTV